MLWDGTYDFSSLSEKTRKSNRLQMWLQRQHFLLSYLKTLSVGPIAFSPADSKCQAFVKRASTGNRLLMTSLTHAHPRKGRRGTSKTRLDIKTSYSGFQISERSQSMITLPWLQSATKLLRHCTLIGWLRRTKESAPLPCPLHSKLGCLLFSIGS